MHARARAERNISARLRDSFREYLDAEKSSDRAQNHRQDDIGATMTYDDIISHVLSQAQNRRGI
jgi:uncharacterized damage-inducible protein DinB